MHRQSSATLEALQAQAERAVLIPVGAALIARDAVVEVVEPYTSRETAEKKLSGLQGRLATSLKKSERRGSTARNRAVREVKRTRTRVERELRQRRTKVTKTVQSNRRDLERQVKATRREVQGQAESLVNRVTALA